MISSNGHHEQGAKLAESILSDRRNLRGNVNAMIAMLADHQARLVPVREDVAASIQFIAAQLMRDNSPRMRAAGAKLAQAALAHNLEVIRTALKEVRLESGDATERVERRDITVTVPRVSRITET